jgi:hypothetical protein
MAAVQDTEQQQWCFTGVSQMQSAANLHRAIEQPCME